MVMVMSVSEIGNLILRARERIEQTRESFAAEVGVCSSTIRNIETGRTQSMKKKHLPRLAVALSLPLEEVAKMNRAAAESAPTPKNTEVQRSGRRPM
jgi:transcriptional regulator with XRE-family HTH domain